MFLYELMCRLPVPRSFLGKVLAVSFVGVHVPMIGAVLYVLAAADISLEQSIGLLAALLVATLLGTLATLAALTFLLVPIHKASSALEGYLERNEIPALPTNYTDAAGRLMANVQKSVTHLDLLIDSAKTQRQDALSAHRTKFELLASLSHEIRTPLNHVIGFAELMSSEALGPMGGQTYKSYARNIGSSGQGLLELLQSILELSAAEAGLVNADMKPMKLLPFLRRTLGLVHETAQAQNIEVDFVTTQVDDIAIQSDERTMKQVVLHSLQIAMATPQTTTRIGVKVDLLTNQAVVIIHSDSPWKSDDIPPEFQSVGHGRDTTSPAAATPTAVRIAMVSSLIKTIGGEIWIDAGKDQPGRALSLVMPLASEWETEAPMAA